MKSFIFKETFIFDGGALIGFFDAGGVVRAAESEAGIVALLLKDADLAVQAAKDVHHRTTDY